MWAPSVKLSEMIQSMRTWESTDRGTRGGGDSKQRRSIMSRDPTMQISKDCRTEDKARTSESGFRLATRSELGVATFE